jgi:hypothetical protein
MQEVWGDVAEKGRLHQVRIEVTTGMIRFTPYRSGSDANLNTVDDGESTLMLDCGVRWSKLSQLLKGHATSC